MRSNGTSSTVVMSAAQQSFWEQAYEALRQSVYGALVTQTHLAAYLDSIDLVVDDRGVRFDTTALVAMLNAKKDTANETRRIEDLADLARYASASLNTVGFDAKRALAQWLDSVAASSTVNDAGDHRLLMLFKRGAAVCALRPEPDR